MLWFSDSRLSVTWATWPNWRYRTQTGTYHCLNLLRVVLRLLTALRSRVVLGTFLSPHDMAKNDANVWTPGPESWQTSHRNVFRAGKVMSVLQHALIEMLWWKLLDTRMLVRERIRNISHWPSERSRWLDSGQVLFRVFTVGVEVHKLAKSERSQYRTSLVNKGFITWFSGKCFLRNTAGSPQRAR